MEAIHSMETRRLVLQRQLDSMKTQAERNKWGQFATPTELATDIFAYAKSLMSAEGGLAGWLIPSEFLDVNYGKQIRKYLQESVTLLRIHRFDPKEVQFSDALVSSAVVWFRKSKPPVDHEVEFTFGGTLTQPHFSRFISISALDAKTKWTRLSLMNINAPSVISDISQLETSDLTLSYNSVSGKGSGACKQLSFAGFVGPAGIKAHRGKKLADLFHVKRGLATGANDYFVLNERQVVENRIPAQFLLPVLPVPRMLPFDEVMADDEGLPLLENRQFLLACDLAEADIQAHYEPLWEYLQIGIKKGVSKGYICSHRNPWYTQERRPACLFLCAYMGRQNSKRGTPFRFILNHSKATATNAYHMLYPKPHLQRALEADPQLARVIWQALSTLSQDSLIEEGRVYGGGLHKMEPRELANVPADLIFTLLESNAALIIP